MVRNSISTSIVVQETLASANDVDQHRIQVGMWLPRGSAPIAALPAIINLSRSSRSEAKKGQRRRAQRFGKQQMLCTISGKNEALFRVIQSINDTLEV